MPRNTRSHLNRARVAIISAAVLAVFIIWPAALAHLAGRPQQQAAPGDDGGVGLDAEFVRAVPLAASDVVYNPADQTLYASVPASAGAAGNSIAPVNPATGEVGAPVFVGSEPRNLAMSDDGRTLYVYLDGAYGVRRFDTQTRTAGAQFALGQDSFFGTYRANDLAVAPGNPNLVAVARYYLGTSPPEAGVAVFDNGVRRTKTGPGHSDGPNYLAFSPSESKLYGGGDQALKTMTIDATGVTVAASTNFQVGFRIKFAGGRVYSSSGQVVDPDAGTLLGTFSGVNTNAFVADPAAGRAYYLGRDNFSSSGPLTLKAFDLSTFVPVGSATINGIQGQPTTLVRWGANGLAFRTDTNQLYIIQTNLISADAVPSPTPPTPTPTATPTPVPPATFVRQLSLPTNDLLYNPQTETIYASVPSRAGARGNSVTRVDPKTGQIGQSTFVGSEPGRLALADDNQTMYVGLNGAGAVRRLDVSSQTAGLQFHLGGSNFDGPYRPDDISVMPGSPGTVAVSRLSGGTSVFDDGVPRAQSVNFGGEVVFGSPTRLYVGNNKLAVAPAGLSSAGTFPTVGSGTFHLANGLLYLSGGTVLDPEAGVITGRFGENGFGFDNSVAVDAARGRVYFLTSSNGWTLRAYDINTYRLLGSVVLQGIQSGGGPGGGSTGLVRWGKNGLAFRTGERIVLVETALVDPAEPVPTPTPTPSATPTPTPPYVPTVVRRIDLPANDLVIDPAAQTLYASVPSSAGAGGNSIAPINPATGEVGQSTFVGSEPGKLALSGDGRTLYVNLNGAKVVRRFDVPTKTPGIQFAVGVDSPPDMEVVPGSPNSLVVARGSSFNGVAVFDNGVQRTNAGTGGFVSSFSIAFGATPSILYGSDGGSDFAKFTVDASGVTFANSARGMGLGSQIEFAGGRVYGATGRVIDPEAKTFVGTFNLGGSLIAVDPALGRAFFLSNSSFGTGSLVLSAYDINTFLPVGSVTLPNVTGRPVGLVRWGANGLAFCTVRNSFDSANVTSAVYLIQTALVSDAVPIPSAVQLSAATYNGNESQSANNVVTVTVSRTGGISGTSTVSYATSDGTAAAGSDYTATSGTLTFAPNEVTKTFTVPLLDDNVFEGGETFNVTLSGPGGASLGTPAAAVVTISDNEFQPSFVLVNPSVVEGNSGATAAEVIVRLSNATTKTVTANYATSDGTATAGSDYTAASGSLTFQPGEIEKKIVIQITGDTADEGNENFFVDFTAAVNVNSFGRASVTIVDDERSTVQFSAPTYTASEGAGRAVLSVSRFGDVSNPASVDYITIDSTQSIPCAQVSTSNPIALARCDYTTTFDTLNFAAGEREKTFTVPLVDDGYDEIEERVRLQLFRGVGVQVGTLFFADLFITDNDGPNAPNPVDTHAFFVRQQYLDFLSREPDAGGFNAWVGVLTNCPNAFNNDPSSPSAACDRNLVSSSFFRSREFELKGYFVYRFYRATFNRRPTYSEFILDSRRVTGVNTDDVLAKRRAYAEAWVPRAEFASLYGTMTNAQMVDALLGRYGLTAINAPDGEATVRLTRDELVAALDALRYTKAQVVRAFVESREVDAAEFSGAFVAMQYYGYLRRVPEQSGYDAWLQVINRGDGFRTMIDGFMNSVEYRLRFGQQ